MFKFDGLKDGETQVNLATRFIREFMLNGLRIVEKYKSAVATTEAINAININEVTVSDDSIQ